METKKRNNNFKHGFASTHGRKTEYRIWSCMKYRCINPKNTSYLKYGARGIKVCDRWKKSFEFFIEDMGTRPSLKHTLDRIDNNGNYEPSNCRWATLEEQANNKRDTLYYTINGVTKCLADWVREYNINYAVAKSRIRQQGWDVKRALTSPLRGSK